MSKIGLMSRGLDALGKAFGVGASKTRVAAGRAISRSVSTGEGLLSGPMRLLKDPAGTIWNSAAPMKTFATAKGLFTRPLDTISKGWRSPKFKWYDKLMLGGMMAPQAISLFRPSQPGEPGKAESAGRLAGGLIGGIAGSRLPLLGNLALWTGAEMAGGLAGKTVGKVTGIGKAKKPVGYEDGDQSISSKLYKTAESKEDLAQFAKRMIRQRQIETVKKTSRGEIPTTITRDPTGTYEGSAGASE